MVRPKNSSAASSSSSTDNHRDNGMGFLLVFFPDSKPAGSSSGKQTLPGYDYALSSPDSPGSTSAASKPTTAMKRTNSGNPILTRTQSTISICAFLLLFSFLLFALSAFEPPVLPLPPHPSSSAAAVPRRLLLSQTSNGRFGLRRWIAGRRRETESTEYREYTEDSDFALQGMGRLYRRGTRSMPELIVGHVAEGTTGDEFRLFFRLLLRSGVASRADVVFLFPDSDSRSGFEAVIREENASFSALLLHHCAKNRSESNSDSHSPETPSWSRFNAARFVKRANRKELSPSAASAAAPAPTFWGKKIRPNDTAIDGSDFNSTRVSYGSIVGFEASELDPENSLSGFLHNPLIALRRWACYPMLLGRVKRNFKHIMLADVKSTLILAGDPLNRVRNRAPESVMYFVAAKHDKHGHHAVNPAILIGGGRGFRRLSSAMLTEVVRAAMQHQQHKKKNGRGGSGVTESAVLTRLLTGTSGEHILKNVKVISSTESIPEPGRELGRHDDNYSIIQRVNSGDDNHVINSLIMRRICACDHQEIRSPVYRDCYGTELESGRH